MTRTSIETHPSGTLFDLAAPTPEMVHVEDVARALSQTSRFGGHTPRFYSVAEHALLVSRLVREAGGSAALQFAALHHDSREAYVGDVTTPLKNILRASGNAYDDMVANIDAAIVDSFGVDPFLLHDERVKRADEQALFIEAAVLKRSRGVGAQWGHDRTIPSYVPSGAVQGHKPQWAESLFLAAHNRLFVAIRLGQPA